MKYLVPVLLLLFSCTGKPPQQPVSAIDSTVYMLDSCFNRKDSACFEAYFQRMAHFPSEPMPATKLKDETYEVFRQLHYPETLTKLAYWIADVEYINIRPGYLLLQEYVAVEVDGKPDTVRDFRPPKSGAHKGAWLYWKPGRDSVLIRFLTNTSLNYLHKEIAWPSFFKQNEKAGWLRKWTPVVGRDSVWFIVSSPEILHISFNSAMDSAHARFRVGNDEGIAFLRLENYNWKLISSKKL